MMKRKLFVLVVFGLLWSTMGYPQPDSSSSLIKYTRNYKFTDGIYMNFSEFKYNHPSITKFEANEDKNSNEIGIYTLRTNQEDTTGKISDKTIQNCFGFSKKGILYLNNGNYGFYRMFIIGALSHYIASERDDYPNNYYYGSGAMVTVPTSHSSEFVLDFETGNTFAFTYKNFRDFLKTHDPELFTELEKTKQKRSMIHYFLLKYNEKHPIYFPAN